MFTHSAPWCRIAKNQVSEITKIMLDYAKLSLQLSAIYLKILRLFDYAKITGKSV